MQTYCLEDDIKQWSRDDYLKTAAPYEWLFALKDNGFTLARMKTLMEDAAKDVGVKNFGTLWKEYLATQMAKGSPRSLLVNVTAFEGQPMELQCGDYACTDFGVTVASPNGGMVTVCTHPIMPARRLVNIDTGEIKIEVAYKRGKGWRRAIFDKQILSSAQKIVALASYGIGVDSENAKQMVGYLSALENMNYDDLPEDNSVGRLGWVEEYGFSPYVENLTFDGNEGYRHMFGSVRTAGSNEQWMELARQVRAGNSIAARVVLAASFASVLVKPLDALPFMVHLWGGAGAGKTVGLMLAASVWACPAVGDYVKTFNGTPVANELHAGFCGSLPLCLDELQVIKERKVFDEIIYMLCEGAGKARGAKGGGLQRMQTWRNCTISTGEMPITTGQSGAGAVNRVLEIDCKEEKLFSSPREAVALMLKNYGHAGKRFVQALMDDSAMEAARSTQQAYYDQLIGKATEKQALAASLVLTADAMADLILFEDGHVLTVDEIAPFLATKDAADANRRAYDWLVDFVASNPARFKPGMGGEYAGECWGCVDDKQAYIIKSVFDRIMSDQGYSAQSFLSWAKRVGKIECSKSEKRYTKQKRIRGLSVAPKCICLQLTDGYMEVDDESEVQQAFADMGG